MVEVAWLTEVQLPVTDVTVLTALTSGSGSVC